MAQMTVSDIIKDFRVHVGDKSHTFDSETIVMWITMAMKELALQPNRFTTFIKDDTIELADLTESGERATKWRLDDDSVGDIAHLRSIRLFNADTCEECDIPIRYLNPILFKAKTKQDCSGCGEKCCCLKEIPFTLQKTMSGTYLHAAQPLPNNTVAMISYQFVPRKYTLEDLNSPVPINQMYYNLLIKIMEVYYHKYNADDARAMAAYQEIDKEIYEIKQILALDNSDFMMKRSW